MTWIALLKNWKLIATGAGIVLIVLAALYIHHDGYQSCKADMKAEQNAVDLAQAIKINQAQSTQAAFMSALVTQKSSVNHKIEASHDTNAPADIYVNTIAGLYEPVQ